MNTVTRTHSVGDTFWLDPDGGTNPHLWIVACFQVGDLDAINYVWLVNVTTTDADPTCKLCRGDHPRIVRDSWVWYKRARMLEVSWLAGRVQQPVLAPDVLKRVLNGALNSKQSPKDLKRNIRVI